MSYGFNRRTPAKYDHFGILQAVINGASWQDAATRFGYPGDPWKLQQLCLVSKAAQRLTPREVERLRSRNP